MPETRQGNHKINVNGEMPYRHDTEWNMFSLMNARILEATTNEV